MNEVEIVAMRPQDVAAVVSLQKLAFPPPFSEELYWNEAHLHHHLAVFPEGQFIAMNGGDVVGSCSNCILPESNWQRHGTWVETVGGPFITAFDAHGSTLYGLDITVHPGFRQLGIGRRFYAERFRLVRERGLTRYGTTCRMPDFAASAQSDPEMGPERYAAEVASGARFDRTMTPLLKMGLTFRGVLFDHMEDEESGNAAAILEWRPGRAE